MRHLTLNARWDFDVLYIQAALTERENLFVMDIHMKLWICVFAEVSG